MPYEGWTVPQFYFWVERSQRWYNRTRADALDMLALAIAGALDKDASKELTKETRRLRG